MDGRIDIHISIPSTVIVVSDNSHFWCLYPNGFMNSNSFCCCALTRMLFPETILWPENVLLRHGSSIHEVDLERRDGRQSWGPVDIQAHHV